MLQFLQGLLGNKQQQNASQFGQNLGLQNQELTQQGQQFDKNLAFQQQQLGQQGNEFSQNLALQKQIQDEANALAQGNFGLTKQGQQWQEGFQDRMNVTPGSPLWFQMQDALRAPAAPSGPYADPNKPGGANNPFNKVTFTPASAAWRSIF